MPTFFQVKSYLTYWLDAVDEHSLHSPFLFDFYNNVLRSPADQNEFQQFESLRNKLLSDERQLDVLDLGAGSMQHPGTSRKISAIAAASLSPQKYASLYARIIRKCQHKNILETGTSLGINTLYLASTSGTRVTTFEGAPVLAGIARDTFTLAAAQNIKLIEGNLDSTLESYIQNASKIDLAFLDANHRYDATLRYFRWLLPKIHERSTIILDDIHQSPEMERAWNEIRKNALVYTSIDLYRCGLLFFDPSLNKQHVVLQF